MSGFLEDACAELSDKLGAHGAAGLTLGSLLGFVRAIEEQRPAQTPAEASAFELVFTTDVEETLPSGPIACDLAIAATRDPDRHALHLRFELPSTPGARAVEVEERNYPNLAAFMTAALEASALDENARARAVRVELE